MTNEQIASINRIKANYAAFNYSSLSNGTYNTDDMRVMLETFEDLEQKIHLAKEDLSEIRECLEMEADRDTMAIEMVNSTILFLNDGFEE